MNYSHECADCNRIISLKYDEDDGTPAFCPFCGTELSDAEGDFIKSPSEGDFVATPQEDEFDPDFENF